MSATHFGDYHDDVMIEEVAQPRTLCGLPVTAVVMNDRPATCPTCTALWAERTGWAFPLPETVCVD